MIQELKRKRWRLSKELKIRTPEESLKFIEELGMVAVVSDKILPSFYDTIYVSSGDYRYRFDSERVERMWKLAHNLAAEKKIYYGRLLKRGNLLISMNLFSSFLRLYPIPNFPDFYWEGKLSRMGKEIMEALLANGPLSTERIYSDLRLWKKEHRKKLQSALVELQSKMLICCAGTVIKGKTRWGSTVWAVLEKWLPEHVRIKAEEIDEDEAMTNIIEKFVYAAILANEQMIARFFKWNTDRVKAIVKAMLDNNIISIYEFKGTKHLFHNCLFLELDGRLTLKPWPDSILHQATRKVWNERTISEIDKIKRLKYDRKCGELLQNS